MDIIKIIIIFSVIITVIKLNKPLYISISCGIIATLVLYKIPLPSYPDIFSKAILGKNTINIILSFYTITFLQRMLEKRGKLILAEKSISNIFNSRRVNSMIVPFIIGMLPSPGAVLIAAPIVDTAAGEYLDDDEKTFVTSYYRHISESFLPTYSSIILAISLANISMSGFVLLMLPLVLSLFLIGYFLYVRKIPKINEGLKININYKQEWLNVLRSMWTIVSVVLIILIFKIPVYITVLIIIILNFIIDKFNFQEIHKFFVSAFEIRLVLITIITMIFKEVLIYTGMIERLPSYFVASPIPPYIIFALLFFFGTILVGSQAIIAIIIPIAFNTLQNVGLAYFTFLMSLTYIAMQISPAHVCLGIITERTGTTFSGLVKKTIPVLLIFILISTIYYLAIRGIFDY
ncbi:MAG: DUF401 family protein [Fusobacterium sp.]|uniref:DUF401 family protein n=1 Tax=Fusobacterium sp. TaxID=68766 RepID=UPI0026DD2D3F|nr:DUF401 family protein [Fusobacterium sp.]MDO4690402.1 DUF401 family protein [Fusobacterium sp.]